MILLVTLEQAEEHLRNHGIEADTEMTDKIAAASDIVLNYLEVDPEASPITYPWSSASAPFGIQAAVLLVLGELYANRESTTSDPLSPSVKNLLRRWRLPAMA